MKDSNKKIIGTLMLVDDNEIDQRMYRLIIERSGLVNTLLTFGAADLAIEHLRRPDSQFPDVILLDINMPRMDGFEFLEFATQEFGDEFSTVVVMLTTSLNPLDMERAKKFRAVRKYINKPLASTHLEDIARLLE